MPVLFIKEGLEGYDIGITTPESRKKSFVPGDDMELIRITTLPYCVFGMPRYRFGILKPEQRSELLKEHGWTEEELDSENRLLKHKYFQVVFKHI